jgi:hypothetical protein
MQQAKEKQMKAKKAKKVPGAGAGTTEFARTTRGKRQSHFFDDEFG